LSIDGLSGVVTISKSIWRPSVAPLVGKVGKGLMWARSARSKSPAPRLSFPYQQVRARFSVTQVCPVEDRQIRIAAATAPSRVRGR